MKVAKALVAGIALLALQTASAQETTPKPWKFQWDARNGSVILNYENSPPGRLVVNLGINAEAKGMPPTTPPQTREQLGQQMRQRTALQLADAELIIQQLADPQKFAQEFGVWVLASDGRALPGDDSVFPLCEGKRCFLTLSMSGGTDVITYLAFKWDRSISLSAVVLRVRDEYFVYPVGSK